MTKAVDLQLFKPIGQNSIQQRQSDIVTTLSNHYLDILNNLPFDSENTRKTYIRCCGHQNGIIAFIEQNGINSNSFEQYKAYLSKLDRSERTKHLYLSAAKKLLQTAHRWGALPVDITAGIKGFKLPVGHTRDGLTYLETVCVFQQIKKIKRIGHQLKVIALFGLLACRGLRQMEVGQIKIENINLGSMSIKIKRKGESTEKPVPVPAVVVVLLRPHLEHLDKSNGYLFESKRYPGRPVTLRSIRKIFTDPEHGLFAKCGIKQRTVHGFRHFFITQMLNEMNGDLQRVKRISGHKSINTIQIYDDNRLTKQDVESIDSVFGDFAL